MRRLVLRTAALMFPVALLLVLQPYVATAQMKGNANCAGEDVFFNPGTGQDIVVPNGYKIEVFASNLNFPTAVAFVGNKNNFQVVVLESGTGLPSRCNDNGGPGGTHPGAFGGPFANDNPFTPSIRVFDNHGNEMARNIGRPTAAGGGFQPDGPAIGLAFERGFQGGTLFGTDSNQGVRGAPGQANDTSRIVTIDIGKNKVTPFITGLPTGDHPTEQILVHDGFVIWSQGSATNSGVVGHDNGGAAGPNEHEIACQQITLSDNLFDSGDGHLTSGYSPHNTRRPGAVVQAFEGPTPGSRRTNNACTGAILRAQIDAKDPAGTIEAIAWGFRNPFGIRVAPNDHPLEGCVFVTENGEDERGVRPTNNAPDRLACAKQNADGSPQYHGWPDRFGFLDSTQALFDPVGGPNDDLPACQARPFNQAACLAALKAANDIPVRHVLKFPPQPPIAPLAIEPADVAVVGPDFVPNSFTSSLVLRGAALVAREGDFGFSGANGTPNEGHDVQLVNFSKKEDALQLELSRFAFNCRHDPVNFQSHNPDGSPVCKSSENANTGQAFANNLRGINRPITIMFGPDGAAYLVDYGAVRDVGRSDPNQRFKNDADAPLVQIPGTGVIWKISRTGGGKKDD